MPGWVALTAVAATVLAGVVSALVSGRENRAGVRIWPYVLAAGIGTALVSRFGAPLPGPPDTTTAVAAVAAVLAPAYACWTRPRP